MCYLLGFAKKKQKTKIGFLYLTGMPGLFSLRHKCIQKMETISMLECITKRSDFFKANTQPIINQFTIKCFAHGLFCVHCFVCFILF